MSERLAASLDRARYVEYDPNGFVLAWFGGHGLHVYDVDGQEIDYASVGDFSANDATDSEVRGFMREYRLAAAGVEATECQDCAGTRCTPNVYGEPDLCSSCPDMPQDPFTAA